MIPTKPQIEAETPRLKRIQSKINEVATPKLNNFTSKFYPNTTATQSDKIGMIIFYFKT